jgi:hypothetical protein
MKLTRKKINTLVLTLVVSVSVTLTACGGGGGAVTPATPITPAPIVATTGAAEGIWKESAGTYNYVLVEHDGQAWGLTQVSPITYTGFVFSAVKGQITTTAGNISGSYRDVIVGSCAALYTCKVTGLASATQLSVAGGKTFGVSSASVPDWSFTGAPEVSYLTAASLAAVSGIWTMDAVNPSNFSAQGPLVISSVGAISVANIGGCSFSGTLIPVSGKGYFRLNATTVNGTCSSGTTASQINGVAFKTDIAGKPSALHVMWHNTTMSQYFWAVGKL